MCWSESVVLVATDGIKLSRYRKLAVADCWCMAAGLRSTSGRCPPNVGRPSKAIFQDAIRIQIGTRRSSDPIIQEIRLRLQPSCRPNCRMAAVDHPPQSSSGKKWGGLSQFSSPWSPAPLSERQSIGSLRIPLYTDPSDLESCISKH